MLRELSLPCAGAGDLGCKLPSLPILYNPPFYNLGWRVRGENSTLLQEVVGVRAGGGYRVLVVGREQSWPCRHVAMRDFDTCFYMGSFSPSQSLG